MTSTNLPVLRILQRVDYLISCLAEQCGGEAKTELSLLIRDMDADPTLAFEGSDQVATALRLVGKSMAGRYEYGEAICMLGKVSGDLWKVALARN